MTKIEITFIYEIDFVDDLTKKKMESLAENYISQIVLGGEDITQYFTIKMLD